jgi:hypothetical protein
MSSIEIPTPLIRVNTEEEWVDAGILGFRRYTTRITVGDVVLMERTASDEEDHTVWAGKLQEETVEKFGKRLKEVLGL